MASKTWVGSTPGLARWQRQWRNSLQQGGCGTLETRVAGPVYSTAAQLDFNGWQLLTAIPRSAFTAEIDRNARRLIVFVAALAIMAALIAAAFGHTCS